MNSPFRCDQGREGGTSLFPTRLFWFNLNSMSIMVKPKTRGRPATGRDALVGVRMPPELTAALDKAAAKHDGGATRSDMVRQIVRNWLTDHGFLKPPEPAHGEIVAKIEKLDAKAATLKHDGSKSPANALETMKRAVVKNEATKLRNKLAKAKGK